MALDSLPPIIGPRLGAKPCPPEPDWTIHLSPNTTCLVLVCHKSPCCRLARAPSLRRPGNESRERRSHVEPPPQCWQHQDHHDHRPTHRVHSHGSTLPGGLRSGTQRQQSAHLSYAALWHEEPQPRSSSGPHGAASAKPGEGLLHSAAHSEHARQETAAELPSDDAGGRHADRSQNLIWQGHGSQHTPPPWPLLQPRGTQKLHSGPQS